MKRAIVAILLFVLGLSGCVSTTSNARILSKSEIMQKLAGTKNRSIYWRYMGDQYGYRMLKQVNPSGEKIYRVRDVDFELPEKMIFPLTEDSSRWPIIFAGTNSLPKGLSLPKAKS